MEAEPKAARRFPRQTQARASIGKADRAASLFYSRAIPGLAQPGHLWYESSSVSRSSVPKAESFTTSCLSFEEHMLAYPAIDPVAVSLGPVRLHWYGLMSVIAFLLAWLLGRYRASRPGSWRRWSCGTRWWRWRTRCMTMRIYKKDA